jgi:exodeoxyribonuclease I
MSQTLFFYDLETTGISPKFDRIMQFAGQRTDLLLNPIGDPVDVLIKLPPDILPNPYAVLVHRQTPQMCMSDGLTEPEFAKMFCSEIATEDTIMVGYNNIRFDDEFIRYTLYRNMYDPYTWAHKDGRSRWDLLDVVRMTRALRPDGLQWPFAPDGKPTVALESMTKVNDIQHVGAHNALSDVNALISLAQKLHLAQPKLFNYLLNNRSSSAVEKIISTDIFVYTSGRYSAQNQKTTAATVVAKSNKQKAVYVYDLRIDPQPYREYSAAKWLELLTTKDREILCPIKRLTTNKSPAVAPIGTITETDAKRVGIDLVSVNSNQKFISDNGNMQENISAAVALLESQQSTMFDGLNTESDNDLYGGFWSNSDALTMAEIRMSDPKYMAGIVAEKGSQKLIDLTRYYLARNYPKLMSELDRDWWQMYLVKRFSHSDYIDKFQKDFVECSSRSNLSDEDKYLLEELRLYAESVWPEV